MSLKENLEMVSEIVWERVKCLHARKRLKCLHVWERVNCLHHRKILRMFTCLMKAYPGQQEGSLSSMVGGKKRILKKEEDHL